MLRKQLRTSFLAESEMNWLVLLKDAYDGNGFLIEKDPQVVFNEKLYKYAQVDHMEPRFWGGSFENFKTSLELYLLSELMNMEKPFKDDPGKQGGLCSIYLFYLMYPVLTAKESPES
ncbi:hypothetical protein JHK82_039652 [Glycine max]|nr:hypothetical protein JHK86_039843 [Glycine max]KAG4965449.1 hypothetical protein JHK85_040424 [Glycine max]KAG5110429.1 hypothetical protein JHK82_039652 [Glycine max]KAG5121714.1 hypothetical protein JHK84_040054 [Glycine max]